MLSCGQHKANGTDFRMVRQQQVCGECMRGQVYLHHRLLLDKGKRIWLPVSKRIQQLLARIHVCVRIAALREPAAGDCAAERATSSLRQLSYSPRRRFYGRLTSSPLAGLAFPRSRPYCSVSAPTHNVLANRLSREWEHLSRSSSPGQ